MNPPLDIRDEVAAASRAGRAVVALESTLIAHGLPFPANVETARQSELAVRKSGAVPATIAVLDGVPTVGLSEAEIESLATRPNVMKASRRDLAAAMAQRRTAATTVSATMVIAHATGIRIFATGGIGGVHRLEKLWDVSADLTELSRTPVAVVCAGAKSILDLPNTLEYLETLGVPVVGYGCDQFPAFYLTSCGQRVPARVDDAESAADLIAAHWSLGGAGVVIAQPPPAALAIDPKEFGRWMNETEERSKLIRGWETTPIMLGILADLSGGRTVELNKALIVANAGLAGRISAALVATR